MRRQADAVLVGGPPKCAANKKEALRKLMVLDTWTGCIIGIDASPAVRASRWFSQQELVACGGMRFAARLAEIQRDGSGVTYDAQPTDVDVGAWKYRLRQWREGESRPVTRHRKTAQLEAELEALRAELASLKRLWAPLPGGQADLLLEARAAQVNR